MPGQSPYLPQSRLRPAAMPIRCFFHTTGIPQGVKNPDRSRDITYRLSLCGRTVRAVSRRRVVFFSVSAEVEYLPHGVDHSDGQDRTKAEIPIHIRINRHESHPRYEHRGRHDHLPDPVRKRLRRQIQPPCEEIVLFHISMIAPRQSFVNAAEPKIPPSAVAVPDARKSGKAFAPCRRRAYTPLRYVLLAAAVVAAAAAAAAERYEYRDYVAAAAAARALASSAAQHEQDNPQAVVATAEPAFVKIVHI